MFTVYQSSNKLPQIYQMALLLGARVEVQEQATKNWLSYKYFPSFGYKPKFRIVPEDKAIMKKVDKLVEEFYVRYEYNERFFMVPKTALKEGTIMLMADCCHRVEIQKNLSLKKITVSQSNKKLKKRNQIIFVAEAEKSFKGMINEKHPKKIAK